MFAYKRWIRGITFLTGLMILPVLYVCAAFADEHSIPASDLHLNNQSFVGPMGVVGDPNPTEDEFIFKDGKFVSRSCLDWGFSPARYWVRKENDGLHFLAELSSPDHGNMRYEGVFDGRQINGSVLWKKERWYWTIERVYRFNGQLAVPNK